VAVFVAMLRGINVGGRNRLSMADLRDVHTALGHEDVRTHLQSGNVVFATTARTAAEVAADIETALADRCGLRVAVVVRSAAEMRAVLAANPYATQAATDDRSVHVTFLAGPGPSRDAIATLAALDAVRFAPDAFVLRGREVFLHCPDGYGRTKLTPGFFERHLGVAATDRNWRTVAALTAMCAPGRV
jgi:uncharacterized protein (DUF1697 family)